VGQRWVIMPHLDDGVHDLREHGYALGITKEDAHLAYVPCLTEVRPIDATLDAFVEVTPSAVF